MNITDIIEAIRANQVRITDHADEEAEADHLTFDEIYFGSLGFRMGGPHMGVLRLGESAIALKVKVNALE